MTRMLLTLIFISFLGTSLTSCSLFDEEPEDTVTLDTARVDDDSDDLDDDNDDSDISEEAEDLDGDDDDEEFAEEDGDEGEALEEEEEVAEDDSFLEDDFSSDLDEEGDEDFSLEGTDIEDADDIEDEDEIGDDDNDDLGFSEGTGDEEGDLETGSSQILDLQYRAFEGGGTVAITANEQVEYEVRELPDRNQLILEVKDVDLPESLKRPYITKDFYQDIAIINAYQDAGSTTARFIIQFNKAVNPSVGQDGNTILIRSDESLSSLAMKEDNSAKSLAEQSAATSDLRTKELRKKYQPMSREGVFTGRKIHIELDDVDVKDAITLIAEQSGANIIIDSDVKGKTSIKLRQVPWDQALSVILKANSLGFVRQANVLRIATQSKLTREAGDLKRFLADQREAKMAAAGMKVKMIPVSYSSVKEMEGQLKNFLSKDGKITSDERTSSLVVTDYQEFVDRVVEVIKSIDTAPRQVLIEAKIVEARDTFSQRIGINWQTIGETFGNSAGGGISGTMNIGNGISRPAGGLGFDMTVGTINVLGSIDTALGFAVAENEAKILSSPRVVVLNNTQSEISQVTQIPIRQVTTTQTGTVNTATFVDLKLGLIVKPQITFAGDVILDVELSRDFAEAEGTDLGGARPINKRSAKTKVLVKNGQTAVLGGIYQSDATKAESGTPILKDIPILGYLFKAKSRTKEKNELAIFIKPTILGDSGTTVASNSLKPADDPDDLDDSISDDSEDLDDFEDDLLDNDSDGDLLDDLEEE